MIRKIECAVAAVATLLAVYLHLVFLRHAGSLWRDEVGTVNLAVLHRLSDVWSYLYYDSFPIFWVLIVRFWVGIGLGGDHGLRVLGFLVGMAVLGAIWINARRLKISFPLCSLVLLGFNPVIIIWGDSIRAWGCGMVWILLTFGLIWQVVESPTRWRILAAALAAIASVQSTYYNSVLLFAICAGGAAVTVRRQLWRRTALLLGIGATAAISLLPYWGIFQRGSDHYLILRMPYGVGTFIDRLTEAISFAGTLGTLGWLLAIACPISLAWLCRQSPDFLKPTPMQRDLLLFSLVTLIVSMGGYFFFLRKLQFVTQVWYYAPLMAVAAMTIDSACSVLESWRDGRTFRLVFVVLFGACSFFPALNLARLRLTNVDLVARTLGERASKQDLIVVNPWNFGVSFQYYYSGSTPWITLPVIDDHLRHRYDIMQQLMMKPDQSEVVRSTLDRIAEVLKSGNRVWLVGGLDFMPAGQVPPELPGAPNGPWGWQQRIYYKVWSMQGGYYVQTHAGRIQAVEMPAEGMVNPLENMSLTLAEGWREN
jgi:hypothetical protein